MGNALQTRSAFFFEMTVNDIIKHLEEWAPKAIAWERDNVGLQVGNTTVKIRNILLSLDLTNDVIAGAIKANCNLIITHHPVLFNPLKTLDFANDKKSAMIAKLVKHNITVYSAHTNLDYTKQGVSYQLARKLNLQKIRFLQNLSENQLKLAVFVPLTHINKVAEAIHQAGGGLIGEYSHCSFRTNGIGTFKGSQESNPSVGRKRKIEFVEETKLEVLVDEWKLTRVISEMKAAHPYEEVAYDIFQLKNENVNFGAGTLGELEEPMSNESFLNYLSIRLKTSGLRYSKGKSDRIKTVAVCGGSCGNLLNYALRQNADAFVTADINYHTFQEAEGKILLVDAGHYETELPVLDEVKQRLKKFIGKNQKIKVYKFRGSANPVVFYNK